MRRILTPIALAAVVMIGAAACSSGSDDSSSTSTTSTTTSSSSTASTSTTKPSNHCASANLTASLGETQGGAGQRYTALILTNTGTKACELRGFPGVSLLDASGTMIGQPASREGAEGTTVNLGPGGSASAALHTTAEGMGPACTPTSTKIRVYPPDNTQAIDFAAAYTACGGFQVSTMVAGTAGR